MPRRAIGSLTLLLAACAPPDAITFDPSVGADDILFAISADVASLETGRDGYSAKDIKVVRPSRNVFRLEEPTDLFVVSQSAPLDIKEGDLRLKRGPWVRLDEFEHSCRVTQGGQCVPEPLPESLGSLSLVDACPDDQRIYAFRPGCLDTETGLTHACVSKANVLPPQGPEAPTPPAPARPPMVFEPPDAGECGPSEVPDPTSGICSRLFADCLAGPFASGGTAPLYVDDDAPAGGDGTRNRPLRDLDAAAATGRDLLLGAGTYSLGVTARVQSNWQSLCPDQTTIEGDLLVVDGQLSGTSVVGVVTAAGSSTISNTTVIGSLRVTTGAYATVESVLVDGRNQDAAAVVSAGTVNGRQISILSSSQPAFRINEGVTTLDGLFVDTSTRGIVVRNVGVANLSNTWVQSLGDAITSDGQARLTLSDLIVDSASAGLIGKDDASIQVDRAWFNVVQRGIISHASFDSSRQVTLRDVVVNLTIPGAGGVLIEGGRFNSERTAVFGVADTSYRIRSVRETIVKDLTVVNPGYLGAPERNPLDPTQQRPTRHGIGLYWLSHIDDDQARLEAERVHLTGVPGGSILAVRESQDANATTVASASFQDITIVGQAPWRAGLFALQALTAQIDRVQIQEIGELSGIQIGDRGTFHLRDISVTSSNQTFSLLNSFSLVDSDGVRKQMEVSLHRGYFDGVADRGLVVLEAHRLDVESVKLLSSYIPLREDGDARAAIRFVGPGEQDATAVARIDKIDVTTEHPRGLQVEDFDRVVPSVSNILVRVGSTTDDAIHFEDTSFELESAYIVGPAVRGIGTVRKNEGVTLRFKTRRLRNILVDGPNEVFRSPSSPCELPLNELCNLATTQEDTLILGIPSDTENCAL